NEHVDSEVPRDYALSQNFPNPFNPSTTLTFEVPKAGDVELDLYNVSGQRVRRLADSWYAAGKHAISFSADELPSGTYFVTLSTTGRTLTRAITLLK
ncbi:MAG: T9SS type A sorting domain-containing protein, partial [Rhodothermales bacterium]